MKPSICSCIKRLAAACVACGVLLPVPALAELMLNPTRLVFSKNQRAAQIELINNGSEPASYRISLVNRRMSESGEFSMATQAAPGELFADTMLSYSPRQVTLQPGTAQVVRVMVRKPEALPPGEYRSHLHVEKLGTTAPTSAEKRDQPQQIGVVLNTLVGASIPVIVRHDTQGASVALTQLALSSGAAPVLAFRLERGGDTSVYGDLAVTLIAPGAPELAVAKASGIAVYTPNTVRRASLALTLPNGTLPPRSRLRLVLRERAEAGGKALAEATLALP